MIECPRAMVPAYTDAKNMAFEENMEKNNKQKKQTPKIVNLARLLLYTTYHVRTVCSTFGHH